MTNRTDRSNRQKFMGPLLQQRYSFPIEYKYSPFDKSNESIESTKVYGALLQQRYSFPIEYKYTPFDKSNESIESTKVYVALLQQRYFSKSS